jgi:hypothetical protein
MTNKNRNPIDFIRTLARVRLPHAPKERIRLELSSYADLHSVQGKAAPSVAPSMLSALMSRTRSLYAGALALVLIVSAGAQAGFAAEGAVPGDILYQVKVAMSEPIALTLAVSPERKAELSARYASRRVDEAVTLSSEGKLDEKTADELAARFDTHVDALAKETDALEASGDIAVSLAVRTDLEQKVSAQVDGFALASSMAAPAGDVMFAKMAVAEAPSDRFSARIYEKSRTLATTRERLDSALALDSKAEVEDSTDLALLRTDAADVSGEEPSAVLFFAKHPGGDPAATTAVMLVGTTTATTTATSSEALPAADEDSSAASRFFAPFNKKR